MRGNGRIALGALVAVASLACAGAARAESAPAAVAHQLNAVLLDVMTHADALGYAGRQAKLRPALERAFDIPFMAEKVIGRSWDGLTPEQQQRWVGLFGDFLVANYAGRFTGSKQGQHFEDEGEEPGGFDTVLVKTRLVIPGEEPVDLNYRLHEVDGTWKIVDVYLKGTVSELALRRSDYTAVIGRDGFEALTTYLSGKIRDLEAGKGDSVAPAPE